MIPLLKGHLFQLCLQCTTSNYKLKRRQFSCCKVHICYRVDQSLWSMVFKRGTENIVTDPSQGTLVSSVAWKWWPGLLKPDNNINEHYSPAGSELIISRLMQNKPLPPTNEYDLLTVQLAHSNSTRLCISLINLNCSLVYLKALDKKVNIIPCLYDFQASPSGWLLFFSKVQLRFISYLNVHCRLLNNWFSGLRSCAESDAKYQVQNQYRREYFNISNESLEEKKNPITIKKDYNLVDLWCTLEAVF